MSGSPGPHGPSSADRSRSLRQLSQVAPEAQRRELDRKVRELLPNALVVRAELPEAEEQTEFRLEIGVSPVEHYGAYHLREHQHEADLTVLETFQNLYDQTFVED